MNESNGRLDLRVAVERIDCFLGESPFDMTFGSRRDWTPGTFAQLSAIGKVCVVPYVAASELGIPPYTGVAGWWRQRYSCGRPRSFVEDTA